MTRLLRAPAAMSLAIVSIALGIAMEADRGAGEPSRELLRRFGAVVREASPDEPELHGLLDWWNGEWWRALPSLVLHQSLPITIVSSLLWWYVGWRLEPRWGSRVVFGIWLLTSLSGAAVAYLVQEAPLGLFTGVCGLTFAAFHAQFGRPPSQQALPQPFISAIALLVFAATVGTMLDHFHAPFVAWATAMACGWELGRSLIPGALSAGRWSAQSWLPWLAAGGLWAAMHPVWLGAYHWHQALDEPNLQQREASLKKALERDPELIGPRVALARTIAEANEPQRAWSAILESIRSHRRSERLKEEARQLWSRFTTLRQRAAARETLRQIFDRESAAWEKRLGLQESDEGSPHDANEFAGRAPKPESPEERFRLDQKVDLPATIDGVAPLAPTPQKLPPPALDRPDSAAEGRAL